MAKNNIFLKSLIRRPSSCACDGSFVGVAEQNQSFPRRYLKVQQIYRGWALLGFVVVGALLSTLVLTITVRHERKAFILALIAFFCIAGTQVIFWTYTYPSNQATNNWTMLPENWAELRRQWEYSHATSAVLNLVALVMLILSFLLFSDRSVTDRLT